MTNLPAASQIIVSIIPIVGIVAGAGVIFFYLLWNHKERAVLIERGEYRRPAFDLDTFCLLAGLLLAGVGTALTVVLALMNGLGYEILGGAIPLAVGASFLAFYGFRAARGRR